MFQRNYKVIGIIGIIIAVLLVIFIIIFTSIPHQQSSSDSSKNNLKDNITFTNLSEYYPDLPESTQQNIINVLSDILLENHQDNNIVDYNVSINSSYPYLLQYDYFEQIYHGEFIADITSIEQSYSVSFNYSINTSTASFANPVDITCPTKSNQVYPNFNCKELGQH